LLEVLDFPLDDMDEPEDVVDELSTEETEAAWQDIMGVDALATQYSEGDTVQTPQGIGVVADIITSGFEDDSGEEREASDNSPLYAVLLQDGRVMSEFYKASQLSDAELPETDVENPTEELEAMMDIHNGIEDDEAEALRFEWPQSWVDSDTPARVIALKAFAGMGGSFDGCEDEMRGNISGDPADFCADFMDRLVGHPYWRGDSWAPGD
jgi:hypothetical protein